MTEKCGAWPGYGGCIQDYGHNQGHPDIPENHTFPDLDVEGSYSWFRSENDRLTQERDDLQVKLDAALDQIETLKKDVVHAQDKARVADVLHNGGALSCESVTDMLRDVTADRDAARIQLDDLDRHRRALAVILCGDTAGTTPWIDVVKAARDTEQRARDAYNEVNGLNRTLEETERERSEFEREIGYLRNALANTEREAQETYVTGSEAVDALNTKRNTIAVALGYALDVLDLVTWDDIIARIHQTRGALQRELGQHPAALPPEDVAMNINLAAELDIVKAERDTYRTSAEHYASRAARQETELIYLRGLNEPEPGE